MVFYKNLNDLSEKISKISQDEKLRKKIGKNGRNKYLKYFNSTLVADFILNKTFDIKSKTKHIWHNEWRNKDNSQKLYPKQLNYFQDPWNHSAFR